MGLDPVTLGLAVGGAEALGGIFSGLAGTPDKVQNTNSTSTSQTTFAPASQEERDLQQRSIANYLQQMQLQQQMEQNLGSYQNLQNDAQAGVANVINGQAMQITPQEQAQIAALRGSLIDQGQADVNKYLDQRLQGLNADAASRGVRGQALSQLQGDALRAGAEQLGNTTRQANQIAAQQSMDLPYKRVAAQTPFLNSGMTLADAMRNQAQQNRNTLQNPYMLNMYNNERLRSGTTTTTGSQQQVTPGQQGDWMSALMGGLGGFSSGVGTASDLTTAFRNLSTPPKAPLQGQTLSSNGSYDERGYTPS